MSRVLLTSILGFFTLFTFGQLTVTHAGKAKEITPLDSKLSILVQSEGRYVFSYTNGLKGGLDFRSIDFKNKKDAKAFIDEIGKAFALKDGEKNTIEYGKYKIELSISPSKPDEVFMVVDEKGLSHSVLDITKTTYKNVNIL